MIALNRWRLLCEGIELKLSGDGDIWLTVLGKRVAFVESEYLTHAAARDLADTHTQSTHVEGAASTAAAQEQGIGLAHKIYPGQPIKVCTGSDSDSVNCTGTDLHVRLHGRGFTCPIAPARIYMSDCTEYSIIFLRGGGLFNESIFWLVLSDGVIWALLEHERRPQMYFIRFCGVLFSALANEAHL